jgi:hypothetical protein
MKGPEIIGVGPECMSRISLLKLQVIKKASKGWIVDLGHKKSSHKVMKPDDYLGIILVR